MMTRDEISKFDGYQVFDGFTCFGSPFGEIRNLLNHGWAQGEFFRNLQDGIFVVVGKHATFNTILVCRPNDVEAATVAASSRSARL